ncbi:MAG TPA: glycosyltransferase family 4 protein [Longimicrobiales bacterium]
MERTNRPRLLFLSHTLPFPPDEGAYIRTFNLLRILAREFEVTGLFFHRAATRPTSEHVRRGLDGLREFGEVESFAIPQDRSRLRLLRDHLRSIALRRAYTVFSYDSTPFRRRLRELLATRAFDVVHVDSLDLSGYLPELRGVPVACGHHNVESSLLRQRAQAERSFLRRRYMAHQADLIAKEEAAWGPRVGLNVMVSEDDRALFQRLVPDARTVVVTNGVDTDAFRPSDHEPGTDLVFAGGYSWFPNRDALSYFCEEILPGIRGMRPEVSVRWVGRIPEAVRQDCERRHGIRFTGYVDDVRPLVQDAACYIVPLRVGGGTRLKVLDAWALGKAVVSTTVGCAGLVARPGENILIADTPADFARAVDRVLRDDALRRRLGEQGRRTAEMYYDWRVVGRVLLEAYRDLHRTANAPDARAPAGRGPR